MTHGAATRSHFRFLAVLAAGIAILYFARAIFIPVALALLLAFVMTPISDALRRLHLGKTIASLITLVLAFAAMALLTSVLFQELLDLSAKLPNYEQKVRQRVQDLSGMRLVGTFTRGFAALSQGLSVSDDSAASSESKPRTPQTNRPVPVEVVSSTGSPLSMVRDFAAPLLGPLGQFGIVLVFTAFILLNKEDVRNRFVRLAGLSQIGATTLALDDAALRVGRFLQFALVINVCFGALIGVGLFAIGLPNVLLWALLAGAMRFVPYAGIFISGSIPLVLSVALFPGWLQPCLVLLLFGALEIVVANALEPLVYGAKTGTSPLGLLVAAIFWTVLWGPVGLVLSTPLTVCLVVLGHHVPQLSFLRILLAEEPALSQDARLYQRLLATDREESHSIVHEASKDKSLIELYDGLLIPAIKLAEQDRHKGAVGAERSEYILQALNEIVMNAEHGLKPEEARRDEQPGQQKTSALEFIPAPDCPQQVASMGVVDEADELCARMLAQVLHRYGCECVHFPSDWIHELRQDTDDIIFLSAVPPFALVSARSYCARIRRQCPSSTIIVGMWGSSDDPEKIKERFGTAKPDYVITRLSEALDFVLHGSPDASAAT